MPLTKNDLGYYYVVATFVISHIFLAAYLIQWFINHVRLV